MERKRFAKLKWWIPTLILLFSIMMPIQSLAIVKSTDALRNGGESYDDYASGGYFDIVDDTTDDDHYGYPACFDSGTENMAYDLIKSIVGADGVSDYVDILTLKESSTGIDTNAIMEELYNVTLSIGLALLLAFFLLELIDRITKDQFDAETMIRMLIKYLVGKAIMENGIKVLQALMKIGNGLTGSVSTTGTFDMKSLNRVVYYIDNTNMGECLLFIVLLAIPWALAKIVGIAIYAMCYARIFDIVLRGGFAPIGCCNMVQEGFTGHGVRYLKKFLGSCLQGAIMIGVLVIAGKMSGGILEHSSWDSLVDALNSSFKMLVVSFTELIVIMKAKPLADEVAGAM